MNDELSEAECLRRLGLNCTATIEEIKKRYRYLSHKNHPDKVGSDEKIHAHEVFTNLQEAYERLMKIRAQKPEASPVNEQSTEDDPAPEANAVARPIKDNEPAWEYSRWKEWWRGWRFASQAGPPPRSSPDTREFWPHLRSAHQWWLQPCVADADESKKSPPKESKLHKHDVNTLPEAVANFVNAAQGIGPAALTVADLKDAASLASKIKGSADAVSVHLRARLGKVTTQALASWRASEPLPVSLQTGIINDINALLADASLWSKTRFKQVTLRARTVQLTESTGTFSPSELAYFNRLLLEDAYPTELAQSHSLGDDLYWAAEATQTAKVCYLRFLKPILGDVCVRTEVVISKEVHLTYLEARADTILWWRFPTTLRRLRRRSLAVAVWLGFSVLAQLALPNSTGWGALGLLAAGLGILVWVADWDFRVDYEDTDWKRLYPFDLWRSRFQIPAVILIVGFFGWRYLGLADGSDPGAKALYLPIFIWLIGYSAWKTARPVDYPEESLGERPEPRYVDSYLAAINDLFAQRE